MYWIKSFLFFAQKNRSKRIEKNLNLVKSLPFFSKSIKQPSKQAVN